MFSELTVSIIESPKNMMFPNSFNPLITRMMY